MKKNFISFIGGLAAGAILGIYVDNESKKKLQQAFNKQIAKLWKEYEHPVRASIVRFKRFMKEYVS